MLAAAQQPQQPLTDMVVPSVAALSASGKPMQAQGGLKSFDELPGSTMAPSLNTPRLGLSGLANMAQSLGAVAGSQPNLAVAENAAAADAAMATASVAQELNVSAPEMPAASTPVETPKAAEA